MSDKKKQAKKGKAAKGGKASSGKAKSAVKTGPKATKGGKKVPAPKAAPAKDKGAPAKPKVKKPKTDLAPLKANMAEAKKGLTRAENEGNALRMQAKGIEGVAKKAYAAALIPYRNACRKAGVECEFAGGRASNVTATVRFLVERVKGGVKVMIKDKPKTEQVITDAALKESIGKAAFAYTDKFIGPRETIGAKGAGLGNRIRAALAKK